jgi:hydrogenase maturation protease
MRLAGLDRLGGAHAVGVDQVLTMLQVLGHQPELWLVCIQPASLGPGEGLSPEVEAAVPVAAEVALEVARGLSGMGAQE